MEYLINAALLFGSIILLALVLRLTGLAERLWPELAELYKHSRHDY